MSSSVLFACVMAFRSRRSSDGLGNYMLLTVMTSAIVLVGRFGVHARCAAEMLRVYVP